MEYVETCAFTCDFTVQKLSQNWTPFGYNWANLRCRGYKWLESEQAKNEITKLVEKIDKVLKD